MEALFNYASMSIIVADSKGKILLANPFAQKQFGYLGEELIGRKVELLIPGRFHKKHVGHREKYVTHPQDRPMGVGLDLFALRKDGTEFPVEVSLGHYSNHDQQYIIAFISDTTWQSLTAHFNRQQMLDLIFTVGQYNLVSMALNSLGVQLDVGVPGFNG